MPYRNRYGSVSETEAKTWIASSSNVLWVGALSFEERCTASLQCLVRLQVPPNRGLVLNYPTQVHPAALDRARRRENWERIVLAGGEAWVEGGSKVNVDPYSFQQLEDKILAGLVDDPSCAVVFDITCFTKIHTLALAAFLAKSGDKFRWAVAYSIPENYATIGSDTTGVGWKDIVVAPLADTAILLYEEYGRGVVIPGHEADRLIVALSELEPSGGSIVMAKTPRRPDLLQFGRRTNRKALSRLCRPTSKLWRQKVIKIDDLLEIGSYLDFEIEGARRHNAPIILFPYGPKSLIFFAAIQLAYYYPEASWFVYPIPSSYDVGYTEGVEKTFWFIPAGDGARLDSNVSFLS